jgi:Mg2+/Co2+ transporter CorC
VWLLLVLLFPISFPIALLLDRILGKGHNTFFRRAELRELVKMHGSHDNEEPLNQDEVLIVKSCLEMRDKVVEGIMTPLESVFMLSYEDRIDKKTMNNIVVQGHSRVPVYRETGDNIVGMLLVKRLIHLDPDDCTPVANLEGAHIPPPSCHTSMPLFDLLNQFQTGRSHLYLVYKDGEDGVSEPKLVGIITLEDVIEELIGEEIVDETDVYVDVHKRIAVARARLKFQKQSVSAPPIGAHHTPPLARSRHQWQRSMSQDSQPASTKTEDGMKSGAVSPPSRILSVVAEVEERSLATPTRNKGVESPLTTPITGAGSVNREESTQGMDVESEGDDDTLPLI